MNLQTVQIDPTHTLFENAPAANKLFALCKRQSSTVGAHTVDMPRAFRQIKRNLAVVRVVALRVRKHDVGVVRTALESTKQHVLDVRNVVWDLSVNRAIDVELEVVRVVRKVRQLFECFALVWRDVGGQALLDMGIVPGTRAHQRQLI